MTEPIIALIEMSNGVLSTCQDGVAGLAFCMPC